MLYVIGYIFVSFVLISILFYLIDHSPAGWEDEDGFHVDVVKQQKQQARSKAISINKSFENLYHSPAAHS